jgi:hypothetical protein
MSFERLNMDTCQLKANITQAAVSGNFKVVVDLLRPLSVRDTLGTNIICDIICLGAAKGTLKSNRKGNLSAVKLLIQEGCFDPLLSRPVAVAALHGELDILKLLLSNGFEYRAQAIYNATQRGHIDVVKFLLERTSSNTVIWYVIWTALKKGPLKKNQFANLIAIKTASQCSHVLLKELTRPRFDIEIVCTLLAGGHWHPDALIKTLAHNDLRRTRIVLEKGSYSKKCFEEALKVAHDECSPEIGKLFQSTNSLYKVQQRWRKNRLLKAARRAVMFKHELQAVYYSPERLPFLVPSRCEGCLQPCNSTIRRAAKYFKSQFL